MNRYDFLAHESRDGTDFGDRVWPYYEGTTIGENVAMGYSNNWDVVFNGWMCSPGHRSNMMEAAFEDIGTGIDGLYYTQDFGGGSEQDHQPVAMGVHSPQVPNNDVEYLATWNDERGPESLWVETTTSCSEMSLEAGTEAVGHGPSPKTQTMGVSPIDSYGPTEMDFPVYPKRALTNTAPTVLHGLKTHPKRVFPNQSQSRKLIQTIESEVDASEDCPEIDRNNDCLPDDIQSIQKRGMCNGSNRID